MFDFNPYEAIIDVKLAGEKFGKGEIVISLEPYEVKFIKCKWYKYEFCEYKKLISGGRVWFTYSALIVYFRVASFKKGWVIFLLVIYLYKLYNII